MADNSPLDDPQQLHQAKAPEQAHVRPSFPSERLERKDGEEIYDKPSPQIHQGKLLAIIDPNHTMPGMIVVPRQSAVSVPRLARAPSLADSRFEAVPAYHV